MFWLDNRFHVTEHLILEYNRSRGRAKSSLGVRPPLETGRDGPVQSCCGSPLGGGVSPRPILPSWRSLGFKLHLQELNVCSHQWGVSRVFLSRPSQPTRFPEDLLGQLLPAFLNRPVGRSLVVDPDSRWFVLGRCTNGGFECDCRPGGQGSRAQRRGGGGRGVPVQGFMASTS